MQSSASPLNFNRQKFNNFLELYICCNTPHKHDSGMSSKKVKKND